jgi:type I restriction enzyme S subunit
MRSHYKRIGDYVTQIKLKNTDSAISALKGININKHFMPSVANIIGTDLSKYRVVKKNQFAFNPMHVGRDEVLPISMLDDKN